MAESKNKQTVTPGDAGSILTTHLIFWPIVAGGLALDLWSKAAVFAWLKQTPGYSVTFIDGFLNFVLAENPGAAFGIAAGQRYLLISISCIALVVILAMVFFYHSGKKIFTICLGLLAAGVCGNLYDRFFHDGFVRDFIDVAYWPGKHWPAFNVADSMLCIGVGLLLVATIFESRASK